MAKCQCSVIAIHGLNPLGSEDHAIETWQDKTSGSLWLRDRIPPKLPNVRIFLYQYNSSPVFGTTQDRFIHEANDFLERVRLKRRGVSEFYLGPEPLRVTPLTPSIQQGSKASSTTNRSQSRWYLNQAGTFCANWVKDRR